MRVRVGALAFVATVLAVVSGGCRFSGDSAIYMTIDSGGFQHRDQFFTDSANIYCTVLFSTAKQDSTIDFTIVELSGPNGTKPLYNIFAVGEDVPGPSTETPVTFQIPPNGIGVEVTCLGICVQNGVGCPAGYVGQGDDSAGVGGTCCFSPTSPPASCQAVIPYPVGTFQCQVQIDGVLQPEQPIFNIDYPPPVAGTTMICPVPPPVSGYICAGWVPPGSQCQGFYKDQICKCAGASWECEVQ